MSPKTGAILGGIMLVLYIGISMMSGSQGDPYGEGRGSRNYVADPVISHPAEEAYLLVLKQEVAPGTNGAFFDEEVKEALREMLEEAMQEGLNLADPKGRVRGDLGTVQASVMLKDKEYKGTGSESFKRWSMPYFVKLDLEVSTAGNSSTWDGFFSAEVESSPPARLREGSLLGARTNQIETLMELLAKKLKSKGPFRRFG